MPRGYFVVLDEESSSFERVQKLLDAKIPHKFYQDFKESDDRGVLLSRTCLRQALQLWQAVIEDVDDYTYDNIDVVEVKFRDPEKPLDVEFGYWESPLSNVNDQLASLAKILIPYVKTDIELSWPGNSVDDEHDNRFLDPRFFIHFCSVRGSRSYDVCAMPETIFGIRDTGGRRCFHVHDRRNDIIDPKTRWHVAELYKNQLFIHCNSIGTADKTLEVFQHILSRTVEKITAGEVSADEIMRQFDELLRSERLQQVVNLCQDSIIKEIKTLSDKLSNARANEEDLRTAICRCADTQRSLTESLVIAETKKQQIPSDKIISEFQKVSTLPQVTSCRIVDSNIEVHTKPLMCTDSRDGKRYDIGEFDIYIQVSGGKTPVLAVNRTRQKSGCCSYMQAPAFHQTGECLLKAFQQLAPKLLAAYDFSTLVSLTLQAIETLDVSDPSAQYIRNWPEAKPIEAPIIETPATVAAG